MKIVGRVGMDVYTRVLITEIGKEATDLAYRLCTRPKTFGIF